MKSDKEFQRKLNIILCRIDITRNDKIKNGHSDINTWLESKVALSFF